MSQENDRQLPDGWQWVKLGDVCEIINGYAFKLTDGHIFQYKDKYCYVKASNS